MEVQNAQRWQSWISQYAAPAPLTCRLAAATPRLQAASLRLGGRSAGLRTGLQAAAVAIDILLGVGKRGLCAIPMGQLVLTGGTTTLRTPQIDRVVHPNNLQTPVVRSGAGHSQCSAPNMTCQTHGGGVGPLTVCQCVAPFIRVGGLCFYS